MTGVTSRLEHLITSVRQVGFPGIGTEMNITQQAAYGECSHHNRRKKEGSETDRGQGG